MADDWERELIRQFCAGILVTHLADDFAGQMRQAKNIQTDLARNKYVLDIVRERLAYLEARQ